VSDAVWKVLKEKLPFEGFQCDWLLPFFHDGFHAHPPMLGFPNEHVHYKSQSILRSAHLGIKNMLYVLAVEFHRGQLSCSPPIGGGPPCVAYEYLQQPPLHPPSIASPIAVTLMMLSGVASTPYVVASLHYSIESWLPP